MPEKSSKCVICDNKNIERIDRFVAPFLIERMFENKEVKSNILHCKNCNFYFSEVRPNDNEMLKLYDDYRGNYYQQQRQKHELYYTEEFNYNLGHSIEGLYNRKTQLNNLIKKYFDVLKIENLLDFGGDNGQFIPDCFNKNTNKYVYEISNITTIEGVKKLDNLEKLKDFKWDFIMCCHVLEHVSYPMKIIETLISLMHDGSYLYIEVPFENYFEGKTEASIIHEHINFFRPKTFEHIFDRHNIVILDNSISSLGSISCLVKKTENEETVQIFKSINSLKKLYSITESTNNSLEVLENKIEFVNYKIEAIYKKENIASNNIKNLINSLAWWIPVRKWRDNFRKKFEL